MNKLSKAQRLDLKYHTLKFLNDQLLYAKKFNADEGHVFDLKCRIASCEEGIAKFVSYAGDPYGR